MSGTQWHTRGYTPVCTPWLMYTSIVHIVVYVLYQHVGTSTIYNYVKCMTH